MGRPRAWPRIRCPGRRATRLEQPSRGDWRSIRRENLASATPVLMIRHRSAASRCGANWVPRPAFPSPPPRRSLAHSGTNRGPGASCAAGVAEGIGGGVHEATRDGRIDTARSHRRSLPAVGPPADGKDAQARHHAPALGRCGRDGQPDPQGCRSWRSTSECARWIGGYKIALAPLDHAVNGKYNEQQGAQDMQTLVTDAPSSASSARTTRPSRRSRSRSATRPACSSAARRTRTRA